jgi:hypothetical protein
VKEKGFVVENVSKGRMVAGIGGLVVFISLFLSWYGIDLAGLPSTFSIDTNASGWQALSTGDIFLMLVALIAIAPAAFDLAGLEIELPVPMSTISLAGGALAILYVIYRIVDKPGPDVSFGSSVGIDVSTKIGVFVALAGAIAIAVGSFLQLGEEEQGSTAGYTGMPAGQPQQPGMPPQPGMPQQPPAPPQQPPQPPQQPPQPPQQPPQPPQPV